jgi:predicted dehydrogenase
VNRRTFFKTSAATTAAAPFVGNVQGANDRLTVAQIGCGGRGRYEVSICTRHPKFEVAAVCDVFQPLVDKTKSEFNIKDGYSDFRRVLERNDIDAVFVSTPDHWHPLIAVEACKAGKDVYCEKPISVTIEEGQKMVAAARKYNRVVQVGSQQRSSPHFLRAAELIQGGHLGKVYQIECWNSANEGTAGIGNPPDEAPPAGLDWDFYLGPTPKRPYNRNRFIWNYRYFWDYSGGMMTDWGAHHMDIVHLAMGVDAPLAVASNGGKYVVNDNRETPDAFETIFEYPGFIARYTMRKCNSHQLMDRPYGMLFYGEKGTMVLDRRGFEILPEMGGGQPDVNRVENILNGPAGTPPAPYDRDRLANGSTSGRSYKALCDYQKVDYVFMEPAVQEMHLENWLKGIAARERPNADIEIGHRSVSACHLGVIAYRTGRRIRWDRGKQQIIGDPEANKMLSRPYRAPWKLEV